MKVVLVCHGMTSCDDEIWCKKGRATVLYVMAMAPCLYPKRKFWFGSNIGLKVDLKVLQRNPKRINSEMFKERDELQLPPSTNRYISSVDNRVERLAHVLLNSRQKACTP